MSNKLLIGYPNNFGNIWYVYQSIPDLLTNHYLCMDLTWSKKKWNNKPLSKSKTAGGNIPFHVCLIFWRSVFTQLSRILLARAFCFWITHRSNYIWISFRSVSMELLIMTNHHYRIRFNHSTAKWFKKYFCFLFCLIDSWGAGMDSCGVVECTRTNAAGMGDVRVRHRFLLLLGVPRPPSARVRKPH